MSGDETKDPVLELAGLAIAYGKKTVIAGASLAVARGQVHALLGRNGSGKTSLIRCLLGQQEPDAGQARLFGKNAFRYRAELMARVGVTPEEPNVPPSWSSRELADYCRPLYAIWHDQEFFARLERWGIDRKRAFGQLSRGQKSLVHLALALASEPELLILDDPTLGLDAVARRTVLDELIGELADGRVTVFITSHDFAAIESLATHVSLLHEGKIVLDEEVEALRGRCRLLEFQIPEGADLAALVAPLEPLAVQRLGRAARVLVARWDEAEGRKLASLCAPHFAESRPSLESMFIAMTGGGPEP